MRPRCFWRRGSAAENPGADPVSDMRPCRAASRGGRSAGLLRTTRLLKRSLLPSLPIIFKNWRKKSLTCFGLAAIMNELL